MKSFQIETQTKYAKYVFLTKANNGKEALNNLIKHSADFNQILTKNESNNMEIKVKEI